MITRELDRADVINLLKGIKPAYGGNVLTSFSGSQEEGSWAWDESLMVDIPVEDLFTLYMNIKNEH